MKRTVIILYFSLLLVFVNISAKTDKAVISAGLSVAFPGGGQIYNKKYVKALLIGGVETVTAYYIYKFNEKSKSTENKSEKIKYENYRNNSIWALGGEIVYSAIDAFIDEKMSDMNGKIDISVKNGGVYLCYRF